jgi:hypothetical protein
MQEAVAEELFTSPPSKPQPGPPSRKRGMLKVLRFVSWCIDAHQQETILKTKT